MRVLAPTPPYSCLLVLSPLRLSGPFECDVPEEPLADPDHNAACDDLQKPACESTPGCVWCISAAVPSSCFTEADAHRQVSARLWPLEAGASAL